MYLHTSTVFLILFFVNHDGTAFRTDTLQNIINKSTVSKCRAYTELKNLFGFKNVDFFLIRVYRTVCDRRVMLVVAKKSPIFQTIRHDYVRFASG